MIKVFDDSTSFVKYIDYGAKVSIVVNILDIPPKPSETTVRMVIISDTHASHSSLNIPDGDLLIHAGDFTHEGTTREVKEFVEWTLAQPRFDKIIIIAGNHEFGLDAITPQIYIDKFLRQEPLGVRELQLGILKSLEYIEYLEDRMITYKGIQIYGSPWQPSKSNKAFQRDQDFLQNKWLDIPNSAHVLITHTPPFGLMDRARKTEESCGCTSLNKRVYELSQHGLKIHIFGHIHEGYGHKFDHSSGFLSINACSFQKGRSALNPVVVVDFDLLTA